MPKSLPVLGDLVTALDGTVEMLEIGTEIRGNPPFEERYRVKY
jgi:hypothetical protein